jgi:hypothetical protein
VSVGKLSCFSIVSASLKISSTASFSALGHFMMLCPTVALLGLGDPCLTVAGIDTDAPLAHPILCASALNELILDILNKDLRPRSFFTELVGETGVSIAGESEAVVAGGSTKGEPKGDTEASSNLVGANLTGAGKRICSGMGSGSKELINAGALVSPFVSAGDAMFVGVPLLRLASGVAQRFNRLMRFARSAVAASTAESTCSSSMTTPCLLILVCPGL